MKRMRKNTIYLVRTKSGKPGKIYNCTDLINNKLIVYLDDDTKMLCDERSLEVIKPIPKKFIRNKNKSIKSTVKKKTNYNKSYTSINPLKRIKKIMKYDLAKINNIKEKDIIDLFNNPLLLDQEEISNIDYGKTIAPFNEHYIKFNINNYVDKKIMLDGSRDSNILEEKYNIDVSNNCPGFDIFNIINEKKYQIKFRQTAGKTPFSRQLHFENTRRQSKKNKNSSSKSGHVAYSINEFDFVIFTLCHYVDNNRPNYKDWSFTLIPINELEDPNNLGYCLTHIQSNIVKKYYIKNIDELSKLFI